MMDHLSVTRAVSPQRGSRSPVPLRFVNFHSRKTLGESLSPRQHSSSSPPRREVTGTYSPVKHHSLRKVEIVTPTTMATATATGTATETNNHSNSNSNSNRPTSARLPLQRRPLSGARRNADDVPDASLNNTLASASVLKAAAAAAEPAADSSSSSSSGAVVASSSSSTMRRPLVRRPLARPGSAASSLPISDASFNRSRLGSLDSAASQTPGRVALAFLQSPGAASLSLNSSVAPSPVKPQQQQNSNSDSNGNNCENQNYALSSQQRQQRHRELPVVIPFWAKMPHGKPPVPKAAVPRPGSSTSSLQRRPMSSRLRQRTTVAIVVDGDNSENKSPQQAPPPQNDEDEEL